ncbi:MAG TPA: hypothetical protein PL033_03670 [Candidatus Brocadiia bacterium]|nr:hypothetical protein [Candidatus Brocadiia bacterium]
MTKARGDTTPRKLALGCLALFAVFTLSLLALQWLGREHHPPDYEGACRSNLRTLATALAIYADDFDGKLPSAKNIEELKSVLMEDYITSELVFECPYHDFWANRTIRPYEFNAALSGASLLEISGGKDWIRGYCRTSELRDEAWRQRKSNEATNKQFERIPWVVRCREARHHERYRFYLFADGSIRSSSPTYREGPELAVKYDTGDPP